MTVNPQYSVQDCGGVGPNNSSNLVNPFQVIAAPSRIWVATFSINYSAVPLSAFAGHGPAQGDIVILKCADLGDPLVRAQF
jgi:hypothetical protein